MRVKIPAHVPAMPMALLSQIYSRSAGPFPLVAAALPYCIDMKPWMQHFSIAEGTRHWVEVCNYYRENDVSSNFVLAYFPNTHPRKR